MDGLRILVHISHGIEKSPSEANRQAFQEERFNETRKTWLLSPVREFFTYQQFLRWYSKINGRDFRIENADSDLVPAAVIPTNEQRGTNRLIDKFDLFRDRKVLNIIRRSLADNLNVMTVYGNGHFPRQLPVYQKVFGEMKTPVAKCGDPGPIPKLHFSQPCPTEMQRH